MGVLSDGDRRVAWAKFMSDESNTHGVTGDLTKNELRDLVDTLDIRIDAFLTGLNIPLISNLSSLTTKQQLVIVLNDISRRLEVA